MIDDDIVSPAFNADQPRFHALCATLRRDDPVRWMEPAGYRPFWLLTKHADIVEVERRSDQFLIAPRTMLAPRPVEEGRPVVGGGRRIMRALQGMDDPDHKRYRAITRGWFQPARLAAVEAEVVRHAREAVAEIVAAGGEIEVVERIATRFPLLVILSMLGLPDDDLEPLRSIVDRVFKFASTDAARSGATDPGAVATYELFDYFEPLLRDRLAHPRNDLLSVIAAAEIDGTPIARRDALSYCVQLLGAGYEGTAGALSGGLHALATFPDQYRRLREDRALLPSAIEEIVRYSTPVRSFMRTAARGAELRGRMIREGEALLLLYPSANRDEDVFDEPDRFDVGRARNPHLAFGHGPHVCLGMALARMELLRFLEVFVGAVERFELTADATWAASNFIGAPTVMSIRCALTASG